MNKPMGKIKRVIKEFGDGPLRSGITGGPVVNRGSQAKATALSEAREAGTKIPKKK